MNEKTHTHREKGGADKRLDSEVEAPAIIYERIQNVIG